MVGYVPLGEREEGDYAEVGGRVEETRCMGTTAAWCACVQCVGTDMYVLRGVVRAGVPRNTTVSNVDQVVGWKTRRR